MRALRTPLLAAALALVLLGLPSPAHGALYWFAGVRSTTITLCFVGDALTSRPDRVQQVRDYLREFEYAANIRFDYRGTCPAPTTQANGNDSYANDIRVILPSINISGTGAVPGKGCPMFKDANGHYNGGNDGWGSWSNSPNDLTPNRSCLYNLKLGDDPWNATPYLNHTLHEFGHALGLAHEHTRNDVNVSGCTEGGYGGSASTGFITPYDRYSVMHYQFLSCGINGNYAHTGLSEWDKLALHIMYPETDRLAEFVGTTVIKANSALQLNSAWAARGANMSFVANTWKWQINGTTLSTGTSLNTTLATAGTYTLSISHNDFLGRTYSYNGTVRVLSASEYTQKIVAPAAAQTSLL